ncbi:TatD family hydrolase [Halosquirtibacter laminarini]|uniref:TatD family hydrolase n=1 Tax=Halosquirtibacter laminarini TaxID=3374600 RepID=A0AC61NC18_9BACT|nr:TatD family hydrolase [Prolixibacteraceae bacterium]
MDCILIDIHTHHAINTEERDILTLSSYSIYDTIDESSYFSLGIHPWDIDNHVTDCALFLIQNRIHSPNCIAIGEIGLDYVKNKNREAQMYLFKSLLEMANKNEMPVLLHVVKAYHDLLRFKSLNSTPWIIHAFKPKGSIMKSLENMNIYFSLGVREILWASKMDTLQLVPLDRLFLETDNSENDILSVYELYSAKSGIAVNSLKKIIFENFYKIFTVK